MTTYLRHSMTVGNKLEADEIDNQGSRRYVLTELISDEVQATFEYNVIDTDRVIVLDMPDTDDITINLPHPTEHSGRIIKIFELGNLDGTHTLFVTTPDGHASGWNPLVHTLASPQHLICISDGVNWDVFAMLQTPPVM